MTVTVDNFDRAETDRYFTRCVDQGGFGAFFHIRQPTPIDEQDVIRMNRHTLYSSVVVDLASPVTIVKPDPGGRFQSLMPINEDHSIFAAEHGGGEFTYTQELLDARYAMFVVRTFADAGDPHDITAPTRCRIASRSGRRTSARSRCPTGIRGHSRGYARRT